MRCISEAEKEGRGVIVLGSKISIKINITLSYTMSIDRLRIIDYQNTCSTLREKIRHWKGTRGLQNYPKLTRPAQSSVHHCREYTGPSHTTRHASRSSQCTSTTIADDKFHSHVYSTAGTLIIYNSYISMTMSINIEY